MSPIVSIIAVVAVIIVAAARSCEGPVGINAAKQQGNEPKKQAAPAQTQAEIDADRERIMGVTSDSIVRRQPMMAEGFSLFRKRT